MDLWTRFEATCRNQGERPALVTPEGTWTFGELAGAAEHLALELARDDRVAEGRLVGVAQPNSVGFVISLLALLRSGAVVGLIPPKYGVEEWRAIEEGVGPISLLATTDAADRRSAGHRGRAGWIPLRTVPGAADLLFQAAGPPGAGPPDLAGVRLVKFTSGSTGTPKAIPLSDDNVLAEAENVARTLDLGPSDRILAPVPLCHSYGFDLGVLPMLCCGATLHTEETLIPRRTLAALAGGAVSLFLGVPAIYRFLLDAASDPPPSLAGVRHLLSCTAPLGPGVIASFHRSFGAPICQHYGSSETGAVANHVPAMVMDRPLSVGRPMPGVEVEIAGNDGAPSAPGGPGEVVVRSRAAARGYLMGGPDGPSPFRDGAFHTGDQGVLDGEGLLSILGRLDDLINVGGLKVSPAEVCRVIESHPRVREALVHGAADRAGGEVVEGMVTLRQPATEEEILEFCRERLADYKVPRRIRICRELPRGATGKLVPPRKGRHP